MIQYIVEDGITSVSANSRKPTVEDEISSLTSVNDDWKAVVLGDKLYVFGGRKLFLEHMKNKDYNGVPCKCLV